MGLCSESASPIVVLASGSPRRSELLYQLGIEPMIVSTDIDESRQPDESAAALVERLARQKAVAGWQAWASNQANGASGTDPSPSGWMVIAADTVVEVAGSVLGKPEDQAEAERMLRALSGTEHHVYSGVAVGLIEGTDLRPDQAPYNQRTLEPISSVAKTKVTMRTFDTDTIQWYIGTGEPMDKAGAYGIQGLGTLLVDGIVGSYPNVVGLPLGTLDSLTRRLGWPLHRLAQTRSRWKVSS